MGQNPDKWRGGVWGGGGGAGDGATDQARLGGVLLLLGRSLLAQQRRQIEPGACLQNVPHLHPHAAQLLVHALLGVAVWIVILDVELKSLAVRKLPQLRASLPAFFAEDLLRSKTNARTRVVCISRYSALALPKANSAASFTNRCAATQRRENAGRSPCRAAVTHRHREPSCYGAMPSCCLFLSLLFQLPQPPRRLQRLIIASRWSKPIPPRPALRRTPSAWLWQIGLSTRRCTAWSTPNGASPESRAGLHRKRPQNNYMSGRRPSLCCAAGSAGQFHSIPAWRCKVSHKSRRPNQKGPAQGDRKLSTTLGHVGQRTTGRLHNQFRGVSR